MVRTDIFSRGVPWAILIKRTGTIETDLNVKSDQKACVVLTGVSLLAAVACFVDALGGSSSLVAAWPRSSSSIAVSSASWPSQGIGLRLRRVSPAPDLLLLLRAFGRDRSRITGTTKSRGKGVDRSNATRDANRSRDGLDSQPGRRGGEPRCRAGGPDRNSARGWNRDDLTSEAAHENWN